VSDDRLAWLTVGEVAEILGCSTGRVRQHISRGRLQSRLFGHIRVIPRSEVEAFEPMTGPRGGRPLGFRPKPKLPPDLEPTAETTPKKKRAPRSLRGTPSVAG
jgi:excisionase family DNA binding protein